MNNSTVDNKTKAVLNGFYYGVSDMIDINDIILVYIDNNSVKYLYTNPKNSDKKSFNCGQKKVISLSSKSCIRYNNAYFLLFKSYKQALRYYNKLHIAHKKTSLNNLKISLKNEIENFQKHYKNPLSNGFNRFNHISRIEDSLYRASQRVLSYTYSNKHISINFNHGKLKIKKFRRIIWKQNTIDFLYCLCLVILILLALFMCFLCI